MLPQEQTSKNITLSERNQVQKPHTVHCHSSEMYRKSKSTEIGSRLVLTWG